MKRILLSFFVPFLFVGNGLAEEPRSLDDYKEQVMYYFKDRDFYDKSETYTFFPEVWRRLSVDPRTVYTSADFLANLQPQICPNSTDYDSYAGFYLYDSSVTVIGQVTPPFTYIYRAFPCDTKILRYILDNDIEEYFHLSDANGVFNFMIKGEQVYVVEILPGFEDILVTPYEDFIRENGNEWIFPRMPGEIWKESW